MSAEIAVLRCSDFLTHPDAAFDLDAARALWADLLLNYPENCCLVLVDCQGVPEQISFSDVYTLLQEVRGERRYFYFRIALLYRPVEDTTRADFLAFIGRAAGLKLRLFLDESEAQQWLRSDDETFAVPS